MALGYTVASPGKALIVGKSDGLPIQSDRIRRRQSRGRKGAASIENEPET